MMHELLNESIGLNMCGHKILQVIDTSTKQLTSQDTHTFNHYSQLGGQYFHSKKYIQSKESN